MIVKHFSYADEKRDKQLLITDLKTRLNNHKEIDTSVAIKKFILELVTDIAIMDFRDFKDSHKMDKITRANVRDLVSQVATESRNMIDMYKLDNYATLFNTEFYDKYIILSASTVVKNLLDNEVAHIIDEEGN
jgi:hypothetical protein